jgi:hypothetical protein
VQCYLDSLGSGIYFAQGTSDPANKVITFYGTRPNLATGSLEKFRSVTTIVDDRKCLFEEFVPDKDGREFRCLEVTYIKK